VRFGICWSRWYECCLRNGVGFHEFAAGRQEVYVKVCKSENSCLSGQSAATHARVAILTGLIEVRSGLCSNRL